MEHILWEGMSEKGKTPSVHIAPSRGIHNPAYRSVHAVPYK